MFPVEEEAAVINFTAEVDGRTIKTQVKKKQEARAEYDKAMEVSPLCYRFSFLFLFLILHLIFLYTQSLYHLIPLPNNMIILTTNIIDTIDIVILF